MKIALLRVMLLLFVVSAIGCGGGGGGGAPVTPAGTGAWRIVGMTGSYSGPTMEMFTGTLEPDAAGTFDLRGETNRDGTIRPGVALSNVDLHTTPSGDATLSFAGFGVASEGAISADGQLVALARIAAGADPGMDVIIPHSVAATAGSVAGAWRLVAYFFDATTSRNSAIWGDITFDGVGGFSITSTANTDGSIFGPGVSAGTYAIIAGGALELDFGGVFTVRGGVSPSGDVAIAGGPVAGTAPAPALFLMLRPGSGMTTSSMAGTYRRIAFDNGITASTYVSGLANFTTNGAGDYVLNSGRQNTEGQIFGTSDLNGFYALAASGTLDITTAGVDPLYTGSISPSGDIAFSAGILQAGFSGHLEVLVRR